MTDSTLTTLELLEIQRKQLTTHQLTPYKIGKYQVNTICIETNPCKHYITDTNSGETYIMGKNNIFLLCIFNRVYISHFYPSWLR